MGAYTNIEQSKKLAEILPLESADMYYSPLGDDTHPWVLESNLIEKDAVLCWSLAALLDILPYPTLAQHANGLWSLTSWVGTVEPYSVGGYDNKIDSCVEMITKLHELKLL